MLASRVPAGTWIRLACERHERDLRRAHDPAFGYTFSAEHVAAACLFIEQCPHTEGRWSTETLQLEAWQVWIVASVFGWRRVADGGRRYSDVYIEVARKNGKSALTAAVMLYCLAQDGEAGAQIKLAATTNQQARIVFGAMQKMVRRSAYLRSLGLDVFANAITHEATGSHAQPINSKSTTQDGWNPSAYCIDELHAHRDRGLFDVLKSARGARSSPLSWLITTAGTNLVGVCYEQRTLVCKILDRVFDLPHYFGAVFTIDDTDDPYDEACWPKANPNLDISVRRDELRQYATEARLSPDSEAEYFTKRLNRWLHAASNWLSLPSWDACADPTLTIEQFVGAPAWIGADLAQLDDLAAVVLAFERDDLLYLFPRFYLPRLVVEERAKAVGAYATWAKRGTLTLTEGNMVDYATIEADLRNACEQFDVQAIVFDYFGSTQIAGNLANDGYPASSEHKNAKVTTAPARELETRVKYRRLRHDGNPCLRWMASNVVVSRRKDDSILPQKESPSSPHKIDGIDAAVSAIGAWLRQPEETSVYHTRGVLVL